MAWVMPQVWDFVCVCVGGGGGGGWGAHRFKNYFFSNIIMRHIKSMGMASTTESKYNFHPRVKLVTLG